MKSTPPPPPDIGGTLARVQGHSITWLAVFAPLTLAYLAGVFYVARSAHGPSDIIGLPPYSAEAVLADIVCAVAPMIVMIAVYMRHLKRRDVARRSAFVASYARERLVKPRMYPGLVYRIEGSQMQIVWNADGAITDGKVYALLEE